MFSLQDFVKENKDLQGEGLIVPDDEQIKAIQSVILGMYKDIAEFCLKNNLQFSLGGGSTLGAVRHQGFIPWDDDVDLMMPRADYNRFMQLFSQELGDKYYMACPDLNHPHNEFNIRIISKVAEKRGIFNQAKLYPQGLCIDICAIDYVPNNAFIYYLKGVITDLMFFCVNSKMIYLCRTSLSDKLFSKSIASRLFYYVRLSIGFVFSFISYRTFCHLYDRFISSTKDGNNVSIPPGRNHYFKETRPYGVFFPLKETKFEDAIAFVPNQVESYLEGMYGPNYMELPPVEKRERHACTFLKLD